MGMIDEVYDINLLENTGLTTEFNKAFVNKNQDLLNKIYSKLKNNMENNTETTIEEIKDETCVEIEITTASDEEAMAEKMLGLEGEEDSLEVESPVDYKKMYEELLKEKEQNKQAKQ
jgi:hypothetical protein